ncbi:unnamed protein product [Cuscuta campestris]|uniref:Ubiquitin carboxyl-terminal hydrolase n=1 Tax=Cuscuta campestris TaxID=132261 RepID=A0A484KAP7_9ASTE|nr:unnamed protein product [Cuscuta campestris]
MEGSLDTLVAGETPFHRRIEFHLARKPFNGFGNGLGGFRLDTLNPSSKSDLVNSATPGPGNPHLKMNSSRDFDPELSLDTTFRKIMRIGAGLQNLGNTCYLNAVLQCLTYTEPLAAYLESGKHQSSCRKAGFCALCSIQKHVTHALQATGRILAPKDLVSNLRCISRNFRNARQEDAHEYMVNLLESMHKCCLPSGISSESPNAYERSLVHRIFGGTLRSRVKCMQCSYCSDKLDPFLDISLEIIKADSLGKAFERFTAQELLDGGDKQYSCQQCKQKVRACKQLTIDKAPHVLTIHLKRFGSNLAGQKIVKKIHYGPVLDLNRFMSSPQTGDLKYTLYGVLVHAGWSTHSGHYYCFVRTSSGMWYSLDDNQVIQVNEKKVLDQKAYMLFYVRDRKSNLPKTQVDVAHKDMNLINCIRNQENSTKGDSIHKNAMNTTSPKEASMHQNTLNTTLPKGASAQAMPSLESPSLVVQPISISKELSSNPTNSGICPPVSHPTPRNSSDGAHNPGIVQTDMKPSAWVTNGGVTEAPVLSQWNIPKFTGQGKEVADSIPLPLSCNKDVMCGKDLNSISNPKPEDGSRAIDMCSQGTTILAKVLEQNEQTLKEADQLKSKQEFSDDAQVQGFSKENTTKPAGCETIKSLPLKKENRKASLKVSEKPFTSHFTNMRSGSLIFLTALFPKRKRKHKLRKHGNPHKNLSDKKRLKYMSDVEAQPDTGHVQCGISLEIPKERTENIGNALITDKQLAKGSSSTSPENTSDRVQTNGFKDLKQSGVMDMLTRGLEETTVATWDGIQRSMEVSRARNEDANIGYIGDEWDEQYDQGKRKKIRCPKLDFDGSNPFQEIANKKAKWNNKKAKLDHCRSANQPFRIL